MGIGETLRERMQARFAPQHIELDNESHQHSGPASESHFRLVLVSDRFEGRRAVARHQMVYGEVGDLMQAGLHALAMHLFTPAEWREAEGQAAASPACRGGSKSEAGPS